MHCNKIFKSISPEKYSVRDLTIYAKSQSRFINLNTECKGKIVNIKCQILNTAYWEIRTKKEFL